MKVRYTAKETVGVCFVTSWFPSKKDPFCTPFVPALIRRFQKAGLRISVITRRDGEESPCEMTHACMLGGQDGPIVVCRISRHLPFFQMFRLILKLKPDIIHIHAPNFFSSFAIAVGKILRIPTLVTINRVEAMPTKNPVIHLGRRLVLTLANRIVAVSQAVRQLTERCGVSKSKTRVIWNSAEEDKFKPRSKEKARRLLRLPMKTDIIIFVGRLVPVKGIRRLVRAMPHVLAKRKAILLIIGDGPERGPLRRLVRRLGLQSSVVFKGNILPQELAFYYNAADVFVLPSFIEGHSVALLEAMASGLPVVATDVGGNRESVVSGANGLLVGRRDHLRLAQGITSILGDEKTRRRFSQKSLRQYFNNFSEESQTRSYIFEYRKMLEN